MKIAVIGSGIAGLAATWFLGKEHQVTLCERGPSVGMDANSIELETDDGPVPINAPMRVFFEGYYPTLSQLYQEVGAAYEPIKYSGSFSRAGHRAYFHYKNRWLGETSIPFLTGRSLRSAAAWRIGSDLLRLTRQLRRLDLSNLSETETLETYLNRHGYRQLGEDFLYPSFAGICTCSYEQIKAYPATVILDYFSRILIGSRVNRLTHGTRDITQRLATRASALRYGVNLQSISLQSDGVRISDGQSYDEVFDHVVLATQANQALTLLPGEMSDELEALAQIQYQRSQLIVHQDLRLLPADKRDWAPVNFILHPGNVMPTASIWMNSIYSKLSSQPPIIETWNPPAELAINHPLINTAVERPLVTSETLRAVKHLKALQLQKPRRIWLCGSYAEPAIPLLESAAVSAKWVAKLIVSERDRSN